MSVNYEVESKTENVEVFGAAYEMPEIALRVEAVFQEETTTSLNASSSLSPLLPTTAITGASYTIPETMTLNSTYSGTDKCFYTKVGRMVHVHGYIIATGNGTHTNSATYLGGLPFDVKSGDTPYSALNVGYGENLNITAGHNMGGYARVNNSNIALWVWDTALGGTVILRDEISSNGGFIFSLTYSTN